MIPKDFITEWRTHVAWVEDAQVEQDLVICRALVEMFSVPGLCESLAFRGGTALYKLYLVPAARYSEDIDLVQIRPEPIGDTLDQLQTVLNPWLGRPRRQLHEGRVNLVYRFDSEDTPPLQMRLKVEINSREHFSELGFVRIPFHIKNRWFAGNTKITTFHPDELLGTKLRALYQRKKGRDLFDLWYALEQGIVQPFVLVSCFQKYMSKGGHEVSRAQFEANLNQKRKDVHFRTDIEPLLRLGLVWDFDRAMDVIFERLLALLPGDSWKGT